MSEIRTPAELAPIIVNRLEGVWARRKNLLVNEPSWSEFMLYWMAQPLTPANPVDIWEDMSSDAELDHYGYESGDGEDEALVAEIFRCGGIVVPAEWPEWDGEGEPAWLGGGVA